GRRGARGVSGRRAVWWDRHRGLRPPGERGGGTGEDVPRPRERSGTVQRERPGTERSGNDEELTTVTDDQPTTVYAHFLVLRSTPELRALDAAARDQAFHEADVLLKEWSDRVTLRGAYSTVGLRADADLVLWLIAPSIDLIQDLTVALRRTDLGKRLELSHAFTGIVRPAEFTANHAPAFVRGEAPRKFLCVYPFVRTPEWYLLPPDERAGLLREHGEMGREFPDVLANTTSAFGINDWEWI